MDDGALPPWTRHQQPPHPPPSPPSSLFSFGSSDPSNAGPGSDEEDICRVCRESTPDVPLLHPCKCSGSIKYVHQDCLLQWIKTKKVTKCELCKYPFKLSKVYDPQMPSSVPRRLFLQRLVIQLRNNLLTYLRFLLVCFIWLGLVPFLARWIWRFYFRFGDWSATSTPSDKPSEETEETEVSTSETLGIFEDGFFGWLKGQDIWTAILRDCFQGQIITICLVAVFVIVFLIREWVMQNAAAMIEEGPPAPAPVHLPQHLEQPVDQGRLYQQDNIVDATHAEASDADLQQIFTDLDQLGPQDPNFAVDSFQGEDFGDVQQLERPNVQEHRQPRVNVHPPIPQQPIIPAVNFAGNDFNRRNDPEDEDFDADDFEGLWDILGMQGPIIGLLHNTVFSALMIALAVGLGVWLPFMFGKTALGALAHPLDILVQHPLTIARVAVDICLDAVLFCVGGVLVSVHGIVRHFLVIFNQVIPTLSVFVDYIDKNEFGTTYLSLTNSAAQRILHAFNGSSIRTELSFLDHPALAPLKQKAAEYIDFTAFHGTITEKVIAVIAGYVIFTCLGAVYLRVRKLRDSQDDNTERLIRDILRQAGAVLKVVVIISIELIAFPIFCGILIDMACLPLFPGATIASRLDFAQRFTFTATFLHWLAGTLYMFHFAMFVSMCREIVRPGTLYFIRDPNDPQFQPIREILERPTFHQLRKIGISGIIYAVLILVCFGIVVKAVDLFGVVLPLKISTMEPVFEVPVDLLLSHIALPLTTYFVKPSTVIKAAWKWWFHTTARMLRLSSFLFGDRVPDEEGSIPYSVILQFKRRPSIEQIPTDMFSRNGSFLRVPATDTIPLHQRQQMLIPVTEDNRRRDGRAETEEQRNNSDFRVVYVPPHFSARITILFVWMWVFSIALGLSVTLVPLLLGRRMFIAVFGPTTKMHDIYAYGIGLYTLVITVLLTEFVAERTTNLLARGPQNLKQGLWMAGVRIAKWIFLILVAGIALPLLCGVCLDLYIMIPFKRFVSLDAKPELQVMQDWAFGVIHLKIAGRIILYLDNHYAQAIRNIFPGHWTNPNIKHAIKKFLIPMFLAGILALLIPLFLAFMSERIQISMGMIQSDEERMLTYLSTYPVVMVIAVIIAGIVAAKKAMTKWHDSVRDEIYLVGEVLHNLDEGER